MKFSLVWIAVFFFFSDSGVHAAEMKAVITKVYKGSEGIKITLVKLETDRVTTTPYLMKVEGSGTKWDGRVFQLEENKHGTEKSDFFLFKNGKVSEYAAIVKREGRLLFEPPKESESPLTYNEDLSSKAKGEDLIKAFKSQQQLGDDDE